MFSHFPPGYEKKDLIESLFLKYVSVFDRELVGEDQENDYCTKISEFIDSAALHKNRLMLIKEQTNFSSIEKL